MQRSRLFWTRAYQTGPTHANLRRTISDVGQWTLPPGVTAERDGAAWLLRYRGPREPHEVTWNDDYRPLHINDVPASTTKFIQNKVNYPDGRFSALTKEFPHPADCRSVHTTDEDATLQARQGALSAGHLQKGHIAVG